MTCRAGRRAHSWRFAQFDQTGVANLLLGNHASINATTWSWGGFTLQLGDEAHTTLMYAAGNGSLDLIETLQDTGADPYQVDTKGHRAFDYLPGYGPAPPNPV